VNTLDLGQLHLERSKSVVYIKNASDFSINFRLLPSLVSGSQYEVN
jgi:hypothetical protein